jgi:V/A-type H+/Na+-transporting ATPase subunit D
MSAPTGRSGRMRLLASLAAARRAGDVLERKRRVLTAEVDRLERAAGTAREGWEQALRIAAAWRDRCLSLDGPEGLLAATAEDAAAVEVEWVRRVGLLLPDRTAVRMPALLPVGGSSARPLSVRAHRDALHAAAATAAADRAVALARAELAQTRWRQRAVDRRVLPRLTGQLARLEAELEERDREENVRAHWAAARRGAGAGRSSVSPPRGIPPSPPAA